jgi:anti-sigma factor RsiW
MEHLSDNQILDALGQPPMDSSEVGRYLITCPSCRLRLEEFRQTWEVLGTWTVKMPKVDLTEAILRQARPQRSVRLWQPQSLIRIAASILVGVGLGVLSALPVHRTVSAQQVSEAMHLDALSVNSSTGWASPLLSGDPEN